MKIVKTPDELIHTGTLPAGSRVYVGGNAATPQVLLKQIIEDKEIKEIEVLGLLFLGDIGGLFSDEACERITHRVIFNGPHSRDAVNRGHAKYQLIHLSDIPKQVYEYLRPNVVLLQVAGPDHGGNYSLGTTVEGVMAAIKSAREQGGLVIAERNAQMPFVLGTSIKGESIDYLIDTDYPLPVSPVKRPDERARRIADLIAGLFINDGTTLQYGIGEVPEAVTDAIIEKGVKDLGIHTELFSDAMRKLVEKGIATNRYMEENFSLATIFLASEKAGYDWMHFNSSIQSRPANYTNNMIRIASQPNMVAINAAIGVDLHGNIWADSLDARRIYSGVGGQCDFLRGAYLSKGGVPIVAMKSSTAKGVSKILNKCPEGITTTAISADPIVLVTEYGAFDTRGLSLGEQAVGIAHLAEPAAREQLLRQIYDSSEFHQPRMAAKDGRPKGFFRYEDL